MRLASVCCGENDWNGGSYTDNNAEVQAAMQQWTQLPAEEQAPYTEKAKKIMLASQNQGIALDRALRFSFEER